MCPNCLSTHLRTCSAISYEPHGEVRDEEFLRCENGHSFGIDEVLEMDADSPDYVAAIREALRGMQPGAAMGEAVRRRGEWQ